MKKNLLILGMSTLAINREKKISSNECVWTSNGEKKIILYYSQLEPISRMIQDEHGSLDQIIILATPETRIKNEFTLENNSDGSENETEEYKSMSAVQFYLEKIGRGKEKGINIDAEDTKKDVEADGVYVINVSDEKIAKAINLSVNRIRKFMKENANANLWIDTQGGFRNLNLVVNAIISLLKKDNISPRGIYSIKFDKDNKGPKPVQDQTDTYKIFDFVSGINEFSRYGRADQLEEYYKSLGIQVPAEIMTMKKVAENIQMCDMNGFERSLIKLRRDLQKSNNENDSLLDVFRSQIEADYGALLDEQKCTGLDIVEWLYNKKFYQQAITYIESKMPKEWCIRTNPDHGFIKYEIDEKKLNKCKKESGKGYETDENFVIGQIIFECFKWGSIVYKNRQDKIINNIKIIESINLPSSKIINARKSEYSDGFPDEGINIKNKEGNVIGNLKVYVIDKNCDDVMNLLLLYKLLKRERNNFNHMSEGTCSGISTECGDVSGRVYTCISAYQPSFG